MIFSKSKAQQVIDSVRNIILDWSIQLEEDGILGKDISFTDKELVEANKQNYTVNNFYGDTSDFQIQQHTQQSSQSQLEDLDLEKVKELLSSFHSNFKQIEFGKEFQETVETELNNISSQLQSNSPKRKVIKQSLITLKNLLEGITGNIVTQGLLHQISQLGL